MKPRSLAVLAFTIALAGNVPAQTTVLTGATVIDGTGAPPQKDVTIVMEGGRIRETGPATGKVADLLVLERNPLENISNMRTTQTIYLGGRKFD
jgi:hypothetical protein